MDRLAADGIRFDTEKIDHPGPDVGRCARLDDPAVRSQYRYGLGRRLDGGAGAQERPVVQRH